MFDFNMALQRSSSCKRNVTLFADECVESTAVLLWKQVRMHASDVVKQAGCPRKLSPAAVTCALVVILMKLSLVKS